MSSNPNPETRHQVDQFAGKAKDLRGQLADARSRVEKVRVGFASESASATDVAEAINARDRIQSQLEDVENGRRSLLGQLAPGGNVGSGHSFLDDPGMVHTLEQVAHSSAPIGSMMLGPLCSAQDVADRIRTGQWDGGAMQALGGPVIVPDIDRLGPNRGILPQLRRRLHLLDLIQTQVMSEGSSFQYVQELGSFDTAVETAELATKPAADGNYVDAQATAATIAHWFKTSRQSLADVAQLMASLNSRLMYGVLRRLEGQILAGDGVGQNIRGVLNTTGIAVVPYVAANPLTDLTLDAIVNVIVSDAYPDAVVANPVDVAKMLKVKASGSGERLDSDGAFSTPPTSLWGLPLIQSPVIAQGTALVGDWSQGATLWIREGVHVRSSDSDQDDFVKNRTTLLGEGRFAVTVERPAAFAQVRFV